MDNKLSSNLIALITGFVVFATDFFSQMPSFDRIGISFFGGYLFLSIYHGWKFAAPRISDLTSAVIFWLYPVVFGFTILWALLVGMVISIPKFVMAFIKWRSSRTPSINPIMKVELTTPPFHESIGRKSKDNSSKVTHLHRHR